MRSFLRICSHLLKRSLVCLQLDKITHIYHKGFETLSWLLVSERFNQCINSIVFKYVNIQCPNYPNKVYETAPENIIQRRKPSRHTTSFQRLYDV